MTTLRSRGLAVTEGEFLFDVGEGEAHLFKENQIVVHYVAGFVEESLAVACDGFYYAFAAFLAEFLGYGLGPLYEEFGGVGAFRHIGVAVLDEAGEGADEAFVLRSVETGGGAAVAGGAYRVGFDEEGV